MGLITKMSSNLIENLISRLVKVFNKLNIDYVFVGGVAVIALARIRTTSDLDIIIDHSKLDLEQFVKYLQENGFDANMEDMKGFEEKMHVNFFDKNTMFRIDLKGVYASKDRQSIDESQFIKMNDFSLKIDSVENLIVNKLIFGSQIDMEDAMAAIAKNYEHIDLELLQSKAKKLNVEDDLIDLLNRYKVESGEN